MAREENFLLGQGEKLTTVVDVPSGGGPNEPPYTLEIARARISTRLNTAARSFAAIPDAAAPNGNVVGVVTMHPRYTSKSDFPEDILRAVGLESLGSRSRLISPEKWGIKDPPEMALTEEIFVAGTRQSFHNWERQILSKSPGTLAGPTLAHIEDFAALDPVSKLKSIPDEQRMITLEVVLHNGHRKGVVEAFLAYALLQEAEVLTSRRRDVGGLTFLPVRMQTGRVRALAEFTFLRVARAMPTMRPMNPGNVLRMASGEIFPLPSQGPLHDSFRAAIFDGGLPLAARTALAPWVNYIEPAGIGPAVQAQKSTA